MTPKTIYAAAAVAIVVVLGLLAYTFLGGKGSSSELVAKCTTATVATGKSQGEAEKYCKCSVEIVKAKLDSEHIELLMIGLEKNEEKAKALVAKKGQEWLTKAGQALAAASLEADKACKTN